MTKFTTVLVLFIAINLVGFTAMGQNTATNDIKLGMPEVSLLNSNTELVDLTMAPQTAGLSVSTSVSDSTARVLISSVIADAQTRTIMAKVSAGVPAGTELKLKALGVNSSFVGDEGSMGNEVTLSATDQAIISAIGTCYSGTSSTDGYILKYTYALPSNETSYELIRASAGVTVTVTLTMISVI